MATIEHGPPSSIGDPIIRTTNQAPSYFPVPGDYYQRLRQLVTTRFEQAEQYARSKFERFYRWEKLVHMVSKKKVYDWKANAFLPWSFAVAEQSAALKFLALFMSRPYVTVQPRVAGLEAMAERRQALIDWHLTGDEGFLDEFAHMFRISERYGKAIMMVVPEFETKVLKYRARQELPTAMGPLARVAWKTRPRREYKIRGFHLDNTDYFPQPGKWRINGPDGMRWMHRRFYLVIDELKELERAQEVGPAAGGQAVDEIKDTQQQDLNEYKLRRLFLDKYDDVDRFYDPFDKSVELVEYQGFVPEQMLDPQRSLMEEQMGLDPRRRLILIANRNIVLQDLALRWDHGMWSYVEMDCVPDPYDFWGKGKIEPIEHMNYVGNEIVNMRVDNVKQAVNGLIGVDSNRMPPGWKRRLVSQPWGVLECYGPPADIIERLQLGDVTTSSYTEQQQIWTLVQEAVAVNETLMGAPGPARTLGEHQLKAESASKRLQFELVGQANQLLGWPRGLSKFLIGLDRQYLPLPTFFSMARPDSPDTFMEIQIGPEALADEDEKFLYMPTGTTEGMNIQAKRADLGLMLQGLATYKDVMMALGFNFPELIKMILKIFGHDAAKFFPKLQGVMGADSMSDARAGLPFPFPGSTARPSQRGPVAPAPQSAGGQPSEVVGQALGRLYG